MFLKLTYDWIMQTELGGYQIDTTHQKVLKNGQPVKWGDKANRLFILLLQAAPQTISKETIFNEVWKGRVVTENTLYKTIGQIRSELENNDLSLESVFGEGYRLIEDASLNAGSSHTVFKTSKLQKLIAILFIIVLCTGFGVYWHKQKEQLLISKMTELEGVLAVAKKSFMSQAARRNELGELLSQRFDLNQQDSWEKRFFHFYDQMNEQERFLCQQIRAYTDGPLYTKNREALAILTANPEIQDHIETTQELMTHLTIWLNKYERVFSDSEKMCLLYVGVEDNAHYPSEFDGQLSDWLQAQKQ